MASFAMPRQGCLIRSCSVASYYFWRSKFGGITVPDDKRPRELVVENKRLKNLLAESMLEIEVTR